MVDGRPAMTRIDPDKVGDFVLVTVRDPLIAYAGDPTAHIGQYLDGAVVIGQSGMFTSITGTPVDVGNLTYRSFRPLLKRTDLPRIRFHDLRHTCATLLLSTGTHPKIVQEMLGHANISMTMDTYSHVLPDMQEKAVSAMDDVLS